MEAFQTNQMVVVMIEESIKARLTKIKMRLDQMTSMLIDIKNLIMASPVDTQVTPLVDLAGSKRKSAESSRDQYSPRRNWGITNEMTIVPNPSTCSIQMSKSFDQAWGVSKTQQPKRKKFTPRQYTPLPRPLSKLLPMLLEARLMAKEVPRESPPKFTGFDMGKCCEFHMGEKGHDINNCLVLKNKVQNLINRGMLDFKEPEPNVHQNPLSDHQGVNLIEDDDREDEYEAWKERRRAANHRFIEEAIANGETIAPLRDSVGNYRLMVKLTPPAWARDPNHVVIPNGWGGMDDLEEPDVGMLNNDPMIDTELGAKFQEKLEVTPEVLSEEDPEGKASWELATFDMRFEYGWDVIMEEGGIEDPRYAMAEFILDEMFIKDFTKEIHELVTRYQVDAEIDDHALGNPLVRRGFGYAARAKSSQCHHRQQW